MDKSICFLSIIGNTDDIGAHAGVRYSPEDILIFLEVAEAGGVAAGSRRLSRSQPAISERLQHLQQALGEPLYRRSGRGIRLTSAGESLLPLARRLREDLTEVELWSAHRHSLQEGELRIAASTTVANYFLMEHLAEFRSRYPGIGLRLKAGPLARDTNWPDWDLIFTEEPLPASALPSSLRQIPWRRDEIVAILPRDHPWVREGRRSVDWPTVLTQPIVWREPHSGVRRRVEAALDAAGLRPQYAVEVTGIEALRDAVAAGLGLGFGSVEALDKVRWPLASMHLDPPRGLFWDLYLVYPVAPLRSRALQALLGVLGLAI